MLSVSIDGDSNLGNSLIFPIFSLGDFGADFGAGN